MAYLPVTEGPCWEERICPRRHCSSWVMAEGMPLCWGEKPTPLWSSCLDKDGVGGNTLTFSSGPELKNKTRKRPALRAAMVCLLVPSGSSVALCLPLLLTGSRLVPS